MFVERMLNWFLTLSFLFDSSNFSKQSKKSELIHISIEIPAKVVQWFLCSHSWPGWSITNPRWPHFGQKAKAMSLIERYGFGQWSNRMGTFQCCWGQIQIPALWIKQAQSPKWRIQEPWKVLVTTERGFTNPSVSSLFLGISNSNHLQINFQIGIKETQDWNYLQTKARNWRWQLQISSQEQEGSFPRFKFQEFRGNSFQVFNFSFFSSVLKQERKVGKQEIKLNAIESFFFFSLSFRFRRGLLLPQVALDEEGVPRTDEGMLGSGIYFASDPTVSAKVINHKGTIPKSEKNNRSQLKT